MYVPQQFEQTSPEELRRIMEERPLGVLVTAGPNMDACHLPFVLLPDTGDHGRLLAHVARANPVWRQVRDGDEVLVIFMGSDAYISPNWYPSKHEFHRQVPTWDYETVHVRGKARFRDDEQFVRGVVARLTRIQEAKSVPGQPWKMTDSSKDYIDQMLAAIVGIEIDITSIVGAWKLSQNKEERDRLSVAEELRKRGSESVAQAVLTAVRGE